MAPVQTIDTNSTGLNVLSFISPFLGLILYLVLKDDKPIKAKGCKKFALIGLASIGLLFAFLIITALTRILLSAIF